MIRETMMTRKIKCIKDNHFAKIGDEGVLIEDENTSCTLVNGELRALKTIKINDKEISILKTDYIENFKELPKEFIPKTLNEMHEEEQLLTGYDEIVLEMTKPVTYYRAGNPAWVSFHDANNLKTVAEILSKYGDLKVLQVKRYKTFTREVLDLLMEVE